MDTIEKILHKLREESGDEKLGNFLVEIFRRELNGEIGHHWKKEYKEIFFALLRRGSRQILY